jgi:transposase
VVDSASIEVDRRKRRAKADRLDAQKLVLMLVRATQGDERTWRPVRVPTAAAEDARQLHRELDTLVRERTAKVNRIQELLVAQGVSLRVPELPAALATVRGWDGQPLPAGLRARLEREWRDVAHLTTRITELQALRAGAIASDESPAYRQIRRLMRVRAIGPATATVLVLEFFDWRQFRNRRQVAGLAGLTPTPFQSGGSAHEQGMSKAGNRHVRWIAIELAWGWLHWQPQSALSRWYRQKFGEGGPARRRVGIVALARKLLIALWRYLETEEMPAGAVLKA